MALLKPEDAAKLRQAFAKQLKQDVRLLVFTQEFECETCKITRELAEEVATLSEHIKVEVFDFVKDPDTVKLYGITKIPAVAVVGERDYGIRFYGTPAGYEFTALIEDILDISRGNPRLTPEIQAVLDKVKKPVHIQVLVSPTCPYCPRAVRIAHRFAMANENIKADMVEIAEFPHLAQKYNVQGVPRTIINDEFDLLGLQPEEAVLEKMLEAIRPN
jgi:glutaredoxin-like protein